jgi:hypothetical protein
MARVMSNHGPSGEGECGQCHDGDNVHAKSHGKHTHKSTGITPHDHFVKVLDISGTLILLELITELFHVGGEGIEIKVLDPLVTLGELGLGGLLVCGDAHDVIK